MMSDNINGVKHVNIQVNFVSKTTGASTRKENMVKANEPLVDALYKVGIQIVPVRFPQVNTTTFLYLLEGQQPVPLAKDRLPKPVENDTQFKLEYNEPVLNLPIKVYIHD